MARLYAYTFKCHAYAFMFISSYAYTYASHEYVYTSHAYAWLCLETLFFVQFDFFHLFLPNATLMFQFLSSTEFISLLE